MINNSRRITLLFLGLSVGLANAATGNTDRGDRVINLAMIRHQNESNQNSSTSGSQNSSRMEGTLSCKKNDESPCQLTLSEGTTGRTYALIRAAAAMKLYALGARKVVIEGIRKEDQIEVQKAESL